MLIPTLEDVLEEQNDLDALCDDRELKTNEIFTGNAFYGNDRIIKAYAGFPDAYPLKVVIPHGIVFSRKHIWKPEIDNKLPSIICYQENRLDTYIENLGRGKNVYRSAAPYTYIPKLIKKVEKVKRHGTIFFPSHSTHHITLEMDYELLADKLVNLSERYQPVTVCLYWRDYNLGVSEFFKKKGLRVVSAGHIFDPLFLFRFYYLCSLHEYSACNSLGSHMFYAQYAGCKHFYTDTVERKFKADKGIIERDAINDGDAFREYISNFFLSHTNNIEEKKILLDSYLSPSLKKTRLGMKALLFKTELMHFRIKASNSRLVSKLRSLI